MKKRLSLFIAFLVLPLLGQTAYASEGMSITIQPILPENQRHKELSYFDLHMEAGQAEEIGLKITNQLDETIQVEVAPHNAFTNNLGVIDYSQETPKLETEKAHTLVSMLSEKQLVTLAPHEEKNVMFQLKMPADFLPGAVLGAFYVHQIEAGNTDKSENKVTISNDFSYVVGVKLSESDQLLKPKLALKSVRAGVDESNHTSILAKIANQEATIVRKLAIKSKVIEKGTSNVLYESTEEDLSMAPYSSFDYAVSLENQELKAGEYVVELEVSDIDHNEWQLKKELTIKKDEAKRFNQAAFDVEKEPFNVKWIYLLVGIIVVLLIGIGFLVVRIKKNEKKTAFKK